MHVDVDSYVLNQVVIQSDEHKAGTEFATTPIERWQHATNRVKKFTLLPVVLANY